MSPNPIPETPRPNAQRIGTARSALSAAMRARGDDFPVSDDAVISLLADLRHFCVARHISFTACNAIAESHFKAEISGGPR
jgi:nitrate reductase cytochrome c-type subunit